MLCFSLQEFNQICTSTTGGMSDIVVFDPDDFNFTQASKVNGVDQPYGAVALRSAATSGSGATATATLTSTAVSGIAVGAGGTLYQTVPAVVISGGGGTGARAHAVLTSGVVSSIVVDAGGTGYTSAPTVTIVAGAATGAKMFAVKFIRDEAEWQWKQTQKGCSVKYDHTFTFQLSNNSQALTTFLQALDAASCCCGLGIAIRLSSGKIFICGEKWVNSAEIQRFTVTQNGSSGSSGKLYDDPNIGTIVLIGPYLRNLFEYSGTWADITALM